MAGFPQSKSFRPTILEVPALAGYALVALALLSLQGWVLGEPIRHQYGFQIVAMKANSAVAFLFYGLALLQRDRPRSWIYASVVLAIGAATLAEYLTRTNFGIDQLLFRATGTGAFSARMSAMASIGFILAGSGLLLMRSSRKGIRDLSRWFALVTGGAGVATLLGHSFGPGPLFEATPSARSASGGALGFVIAAAGVKYSNFSESLIQRIHASNDSGRMLRRLLPAAIFLPYLVILAVSSAEDYFGWGTGFSLAFISGTIAFGLVWTLFSFARAVDREQLAHQEIEHRFRLMADDAPTMIWRATPKRLCDYFNKTWLDFTGRTLQQEMGNGWAEGVHAEDLGNCMDIYRTSFNKRERFEMQYRLRRFDGVYRWILDIGVPRFTTDGSFSGYLGSCIDVTEQRMAQQALEDFGRRMIWAQEEERTWIAREIHDDFQQRLTMLAIRLEDLGQDQDSPRDKFAGRLKELRVDVTELGTDLHTLSHRLHPATLQAAGLVPGLRSLCAEYTDRAGIEVFFEAEDMPPSIPDEVALCLFRVAQEALQNVKKHSGACEAAVRVAGVEGKIHLSISDRGRGFDPAMPAIHLGIGIRSMKERIRLVGGRLELNARPMEGSRTDAWVPI
jgi:PAS domain S-box-containing protein